MLRPSEKLASRLASAVLIGLMTACSGSLVPIRNVDRAPVIVPSGTSPSEAAVRDAVMRALAANSWQVDGERPTTVFASKTHGIHSARIVVSYGVKSYSIKYVDSSESLHFDGDSIHPRYNAWIEQLERSIRAGLLGAQPAATVPG